MIGLRDIEFTIKPLICTLLLLIGISFTSPSLHAEEKSSNSIVSSLEKGDYVELSKLFNDFVYLTVDTREGIFSRTQGSRILELFFDKNRPKSFTSLYQGGKSNSRYIVGYLYVDSRKYQVFIFFKVVKNKRSIYQLKLESV